MTGAMTSVDVEMSEDLFPHPITTIPPEVRGYIFNYLQQKKALALRLVCRQWDQDVKDYYNFALKLDEDSPNFHKLLQLRIVKLQILKLLKDGPGATPPVFKHPNLIRKLRVAQISDEDRISGMHLPPILEQCASSLQDLDLTLSTKLLYHPFPQNMSYNLKKLENLEINLFLEVPTPAFSNTTHLSHSFLSQISDSTIPNLKSIEIGLCNETASLDLPTLTNMLFKLITKNPTGLERLCARLWNKVSGSGPETTSWVDQDDPLVLKSLKKITCIKNIILDLIPNSAEEQCRWLNLISSQTSLININTSVNFPLSAPLFHSVIGNNMATIVHVSVSCLSINGDKGFDMSVFKYCHHVRSLDLRRDRGQPRLLPPDAPDLINLSSVPNSTGYLKLVDFQLLTEEILSLLNKEELIQNLENLYFLKCGVTADLGTNAEVLERIVQIGDTTPNLTRVFLEGFNIQGVEARQKMNEVFDRLRISKVNLDNLAYRLTFQRNADHRFMVGRSGFLM